MSRSTLPDLFKADMFSIKFHPQDIPRKIGGRFSIKPVKHTLNQQSQQNQLNKLQPNHAITKSIYHNVQTKYRSQSITNIPSAIKQNNSTQRNNSTLKPRKSVGFNINIDKQFIQAYKNNKDNLKKNEQYLRKNDQNSRNNDQNSRKNDNLSIDRKHSESFTKDTMTLKQIHYQNVMRNRILSSTKNKNQHFSSVSNFPYQTTRSMNNMQVDLEQAQSFKNRVEYMVQQQKSCQKSLLQINKQTSIIRQHMEYFHSAYLNDLIEFNQQFQYLCKDLMKTLSQMRRETGQETKQNAFDIGRVADQYKDAQGIFDVLDYRSNLLRNQCIDDHKIQLTNRKTYTQDLQVKIQQSVRESQLDKLIKRTKRSGTSYTMRGTINNLLIKTQNQPRAQTSSYKRKPINNINFNNQDINLNENNLRQNNPLYNEQKIMNQNEQNQSDKDSLDIDIDIQNITISNLKQAVFQDY